MPSAPRTYQAVMPLFLAHTICSLSLESPSPFFLVSQDAAHILLLLWSPSSLFPNLLYLSWMCSLFYAPLHFVHPCIRVFITMYHTVDLPCSQVPHPWIQWFWWIHNLQIQKADCIILFKSLKHLWIVVSTVGPGINSLQILRDNCYIHKYI